jgi:hypothetical protein
LIGGHGARLPLSGHDHKTTDDGMALPRPRPRRRAIQDWSSEQNPTMRHRPAARPHRRDF